MRVRVRRDVCVQTSPHTLAGLITMWLRELPEPVLPFAVHSALIELWRALDGADANSSAVRVGVCACVRV
jgi:hypothetical protein